MLFLIFIVSLVHASQSSRALCKGLGAPAYRSYRVPEILRLRGAGKPKPKKSKHAFKIAPVGRTCRMNSSLR